MVWTIVGLEERGMGWSLGKEECLIFVRGAGFLYGRWRL